MKKGQSRGKGWEGRGECGEVGGEAGRGRRREKEGGETEGRGEKKCPTKLHSLSFK